MDADYESTAAISQCDLCIVLLFMYVWPQEISDTAAPQGWDQNKIG